MRARVAVALACVLACACSDEPTGPPGPFAVSVAAPPAQPLAVGDTLRLEAEVRDRWGGAFVGVGVAWSSSDAGVASVGPSGVVAAVGPGTATITAATGGASGSVRLSVADPAYSVLAALWMKTGGSDWTNSDNWLSNEDLDTWHGVDTDSAGRVVGLDLEDNNLTGHVPPELGDLEHLRRLDLAANRLTGEIPPELANPGQLEDLELHTNRLSGAIPRELATLEHLYKLVLHTNELSGEIPPELGTREQLYELELHSNALSGGIPPELGNLANLGVLHLHSNALTGEIPPELGNLANLRELNLSDNALTGLIPRQLGGLTSLTRLWLSHNELSGTVPATLDELGDLEWLLIGNNRLSGPLPLALEGLPLKTFGYAGTGLCVPVGASFRAWLDSIPAHQGTGVDCGAPLSDREILEIFYHATDGPNWVDNENWLTDAPLGEWYGVDTDGAGRVVRLNLAGRWDNESRRKIPHISGSIPPELGDLANLTSLNLVWNQLIGPIPPELGKLANLTSLFLRRNGLSGPIPSELGNLASLEELNLEANQLTGPIPTELGSLSDLTTLDLANNNLNSIPAELGNLANLTWLSLHGNRLSGPIPPEMGNLASLGRLSLNFNRLTGPLPPELGDLANLRSLSLERNDLTGPMPSSFLRLERLDGLYIGGNTSLCVPGTSVFVAWLRGIEHRDEEPVSCNAADVAALTSLFEAAGGGGWTRSDGWLDGFAAGDWHGVGADSLGRVTVLDLGDNGLAGELPTILGQLVHMTELRLAGNPALSGRLPLSLDGLSLWTLHYGGTGLCSPADASFQAWLNAIPSHEGTGVECAPLSDREILEIVYESTGGPNWTNSDNWLTDAPLREWYGVRADNDGRVYSLSLFDNNLTGSLPGELGQLGGLVRLNFGQNWHLTGLIPPQLGNLANLEVLHLQFTDVTGPIPPEFGSLAKLTDLYFWRNRLSGPIPSELGNLVNLTRLALGENELTGPIPATLGNLSQLRKLLLERNALTGPIPAEIGNLAELELLWLGQNDLSGRIPPELGRLSSLRELGVANNAGMSGALPESLTAIRGLDELTTGGTGLCAPSEPAFRAWLAGIHKRRVAICDGADAAAYMVQSVQSRYNPVPLVAGERALLRVFPTALRASSTGMPAVRARFYLDGRETHVANIPASSTPVPTEVDEGSLAKSANAEIPGNVVQPGLEMVIEVDPAGTLEPALGVVKRIPETGRLAVDINAMPTLDLTVVPFLWAADPDSAILGIASGMAADPENHEMLWATRTLLPVGDMVVRTHEPVLTTTNHAGTFFGEMEAIRALEGGTGHWMAMMSGDVVGPGGFARGNRLNFSRPNPLVIAHELGHNMSLSHAPCGGPAGLDGGYPYPDGSSGVWGYDFDGVGGLIHPWRPDLMSYCGPEWVSDYHFTNALRYRLVDEDPPAAAATAARSQSLLVWGGVGADTVPYLAPAFVVEAPPTLPDSAGAYVVTGRTATGGTLFSLSFAMPETADGDGSSSFAFVLPVRTEWEGNLASITLTGPDGSFTLDEDSDIPMAILRNAQTGQIRGVLRDPPPATRAAADAVGQGTGTRPNVLFSRGIPGAEAWRR